jgi:GTP-binding protein HflX
MMPGSMDGAKRAVVVGVQLPDVTDDDFQSSIEELRRLARTLGLDVVAAVTQRRPSLSKASVVGEGKLHEIARYTGGTGVVPSGAHKKDKRVQYKSGDDEPEDEPEPHAELEPTERAGVVLVDHDLTPSQARNLERATGVEVLDRTAVILAIFHAHARTREARIEVEIARLAYMAPRLRETGNRDRQRGGIGGRGVGESSVEIDRRKVRDRISELTRELAGIERTAGTRAERRRAMSTAALVGYTNAGKSSLMRALTGSEVLVEDKLFATLDTTVRALKPEVKPRVLISDTVGFIKKLPHGLVASFRATLDTARDSNLLLHVVDAADPAFRAQIDVTRTVLGEIGAGDRHALLLFNKVDRLGSAAVEALTAEYPEALVMSALRSEDIAILRQRIIDHFERDMQEADIFVPYEKGSLVNDVHEACRVLSETFDEAGTKLRIRAHPETIARFS